MSRVAGEVWCRLDAADTDTHYYYYTFPQRKQNEKLIEVVCVCVCVCVWLWAKKNLKGETDSMGGVVGELMFFILARAI